MPKKDIHLKQNSANPDTQKLNKKDNDEAQWFAEDHPYTVDFGSDSPFVNDHPFTVHPGTPTSSGPIKDGVEFRKYHYDLKTVGAAVGSDPDVEINP